MVFRKPPRVVRGKKDPRWAPRKGAQYDRVDDEFTRTYETQKANPLITSGLIGKPGTRLTRQSGLDMNTSRGIALQSYAQALLCTRIGICREMVRAAHLVQTLFFIYRTTCYYDIFSHVEHCNGLLYVYHQSRWTAALNQEFPVRPFPFDRVSDLADANACLAVQQCADFCGLMHGLVKFFFAELCLSIQEYHVHVKNTVRPTVIVNGCGSAHGNLDALHTVLRAQCHNGASYCLDFTCAQYGWEDYISPWETFARLRVRTASFSEPFGTAHARLRKDAHVPGPAQAPTSFFFETADRLAWIVKEWFVQRRLTVGSLLVSPEEEFRAARSYLLEHVYWQFGKAMDKMALEKQYHLALRDQAVFIQRKRVGKQRKNENFSCKDWV